jgi:DNA polymerase
MMSNYLAKYWKILTALEDYLSDGYYKNHKQPHLVSPAHEKGPAGEAVPENGPVGTRLQREEKLQQIAEEIAGCSGCGLHKTRKNTVAGAGAIDPLVLCIGEGPGSEEDRQGIPFVGAAGRYLDKWLAAIELDRNKNCFIANIVKCRPPNNRDPLPEESRACLPFLYRQVELIRPKIILTLGRIASQIICNRDGGIGSLRGLTFEFRGIPVIPTYHPSAVLRNQDLRRAVWDDLRRLKTLF